MTLQIRHDNVAIPIWTSWWGLILIKKSYLEKSISTTRGKFTIFAHCTDRCLSKNIDKKVTLIWPLLPVHISEVKVVLVKKIMISTTARGTIEWVHYCKIVNETQKIFLQFSSDPIRPVTSCLKPASQSCNWLIIEQSVYLNNRKTVGFPI